MKFTPPMAVSGAVFGSLIVVILGWLLTAGLSVSPAFAAPPAASAPTTPAWSDNPPAPQVADTHDDVSAEGCAVSAAFPGEVRQWCQLITHYASKRGLDPNLVASVILQESGGNAVAYSRSGAVGLMQVMPNDGLAAGFQCPAGPCFSNRPSTKELQDPEFNISYGTKLLAGLVARTGDVRDALKSYGPMDMGYGYADTVMAIHQRLAGQ